MRRMDASQHILQGTWFCRQGWLVYAKLPEADAGSLIHGPVRYNDQPVWTLVKRGPKPVDDALAVLREFGQVSQAASEAFGWPIGYPSHAHDPPSGDVWNINIHG